MRQRSENTLLRLIPPLMVLTGITLLGAAVLTLMSGGRWGFWQAAYFAVICASTVGFGELPEMDRVPGSRAIGTAIIILGLSAVWYFQSALTTVLVEGVLGQTLRRRRMQRRIAELTDHIIVCGAGSTGRHVVRELIATRTPFVVIERTVEAIDVLSATGRTTPCCKPPASPARAASSRRSPRTKTTSTSPSRCATSTPTPASSPRS
jgi:hypothetical protein